jgi:hypothetical protein
MSFICALILICLGHDEELAWTVFIKVLDIDSWRELYTVQAPKLFDLTKKVREYINKDMPKLN